MMKLLKHTSLCLLFVLVLVSFCYIPAIASSGSFNLFDFLQKTLDIFINGITGGTESATTTEPVKETVLDIATSTETKSNPIVTPGGSETPIVQDNDISLILKYTNIERAKLLLEPLVSNSVLDNIASLRADDLFVNQYFGHDSPDRKSVSDLISEYNYSYFLIGENLALGNFADDQNIVSAWMESPEHRENILNEKFTELGVAIKEGIYNGEKTTIAVQVFAVPGTLCSKPNQVIKDLIESSTITIKQMQEQAMAIYNNLRVSNYNQLNQEYNLYAQRVNDAVTALASMIDIYNADVNKYNFCINL